MKCPKRAKVKDSTYFTLFTAAIFLVGALVGWSGSALSMMRQDKNFTNEVQETAIVSRETIQVIELSVEAPPSPIVEPIETLEEIEPLYRPEEVEAVAVTLAGECYDDQAQDKRNVAWVICNRTKDGRFGEGIVGVVSSTEYAVQFNGYWIQSREISDNDRAIAEEVLAAYYSGEPPLHDYLYFTGGTGITNKFR